MGVDVDDPVMVELAVLYAARDRLAYAEPKSPAHKEKIAGERVTVDRLIGRLEAMRDEA